MENNAADLQKLRRHDESACPECKKGKLIDDMDSGERHCKKCGYVAAQKLEETVPYTKFNDDELVFARGSGKGRVAIIGPENKDFTGKPISGNMLQTINRMRIWDKRNIKSKERTTKMAQALLYEWRRQLGLNDSSTDDALSIFVKCQGASMMRGRTINAFVAASIFASCKINGVPRNEKQMLEVTKVKRRNFRVAYKLIQKSQDIMPSEANAAGFLSMVTSKLKAKEKVKERLVRAAASTLEVISKHQRAMGKSPMTLVAATLYLSITEAKLPILQSDVAKAAGTSEVTIRNNMRWIKELVRESHSTKPTEKAAGRQVNKV